MNKLIIILIFVKQMSNSNAFSLELLIVVETYLRNYKKFKLFHFFSISCFNFIYVYSEMDFSNIYRDKTQFRRIICMMIILHISVWKTLKLPWNKKTFQVAKTKRDLCMLRIGGISLVSLGNKSKWREKKRNEGNL